MIPYKTITTSLVAAFLATAFTGITANAADIDPVIEPVIETAHDWSGSYFGVQFGAIADGDAQLDLTGVTESVNGALGGVLGGYNFQYQNFVFGIDSDFSVTSANAFSDIVDINTLSTARLRVGYAFDRILPYATGGLAYSFTDLDLAGSPNDNEFYLGWTVGGGVEYALSDNISARLQYNYVDLGTETFNAGGAPARIELDNIHLIRAGVSIKTGFIWDKILRR